MIKPRYLWLVLVLMIAVQAAHHTEHVTQLIQIYLQGIKPPAAHGLLGSVFDFEWVHFLYNLTLEIVLIWVWLWYIRARSRTDMHREVANWEWGYPLLVVTVIAQGYHSFEHIIKLYQYFFIPLYQFGENPTPGFLPLVTRWPIFLVHFWFNQIILTLLVALGLTLRPRGLLPRLFEPLKHVPTVQASPRLTLGVIGGIGLVLALILIVYRISFLQAPVEVPPLASSNIRVLELNRAGTSPPPGQVFEDVARRVGVGFEHHASADDPAIWGTGAAFLDFNLDNCLDLYVTDRIGPNKLYQNRCDGTFTEVATQAGVDAPNDDSAGAVVADYDNDGRPDLFLLNFGPDRLFHNSGDGTFADVTERAGVGTPGRGTSAAWGDYDGDGLLDLYVANHVGCKDYTDKHNCFNDTYPEINRDRLYHNEGDGTFKDVTELLGPTQTLGAGFAVAFFDYNEDGRPDIYLVNDKKFASGDMDIVPQERLAALAGMPRTNILWRNDGPDGNGGWKFTDVSQTAGVASSVFGMGLATGDYDNDGHLDLYFSDIGPATLLRNRGDGTFENVTEKAGAGYGRGGEWAMGWGTVFVDYDNDGWLDIFLTAMGMQGETTVLFHNNRDGTFTDVTLSSGAADNRGPRTVAAADFDGDGFQDLFLVNYGQPAALLRNVSAGHGNKNHWLALQLVGTPSNRDGIGTKIRLTTPDGLAQMREVHSGDSLGAGSDITAHFGLGANDRAAKIEIFWPSGIRQTLSNLAADHKLVITEPTE